MARLRTALAYFAALALALNSAAPAPAAGDPYLGFASEASTDPPGMRINVVPGSPSDVSGLRSGDVVLAIAGTDFSIPGMDFAAALRSLLAGREVGEVLDFRVYRVTRLFSLTLNGTAVKTDFPLQELPELVEQARPGDKLSLTSEVKDQTLEVKVTLGLRPDTAGQPFPPSTEFGFAIDDSAPELRRLLSELIGRQGIRDDTFDLLDRLARRAAPDDGYKLERVVYLLRDGLKGEALTWDTLSSVKALSVSPLEGFAGLSELQGGLIDSRSAPVVERRLATGLSAEAQLSQLSSLLAESAEHSRRAFREFTPEELKFVVEQREALTSVFREQHYIDSDDTDKRRSLANVKLIRLAAKLDYSELLAAQQVLAPLADTQYLARLKDDLLSEFATQLEGDVLASLDSPLGRLVISGTGRSWHSGESPALLIDLGGDDFYTIEAGSASSDARPVGVLLELGGSDAYESTRPYSQGSGSLGCGLLIDTEGSDQYVGLQWAQGCGFFGMGALIDLAGDDVYRGEEFCQAAAIFGNALLLDAAGDDRMEGQMKCQSFGGAHASSLLIDVAGDDYRYCKGKYATGYGDAGIFDAWGQGCAMGFRGIASGGIAGVIDLAGSDYCEAGNFSQGGGYYFGYGFHADLGFADDRYLGSRYNQGFCAHQAVGVFIEQGGNDHYSTRQAVAQGLAWDECCTMFVDYAGDDLYEGGGGFSQGASAHNALCVFWDRRGRDTYDYKPGQARAGGNEYHGGTSLSLFIDEGGGADLYNNAESENNAIRGWPEHGFFCDLPLFVDDALNGEAWMLLWREAAAAEGSDPGEAE